MLKPILRLFLCFIVVIICSQVSIRTNCGHSCQNLKLIMAHMHSWCVNGLLKLCFIIRSNFLVVGAIDFGTSYSGFAYSFTNDPHKVFTNTWHASARLTSNKTPTCILFDTDKKFSAFGYEAEDAFGNYFLDKKQNEWYFFTGYKMALYEQLVSIRCLCVSVFLAHQIEKSYVLPHVRNSYLTLVISPRSALRRSSVLF